MELLEQFIVEMATHVAHTRGWTLPVATRWVTEHLTYAREEYREAGAPLGDTDAGFIAWLQPRHQPPTA